MKSRMGLAMCLDHFGCGGYAIIVKDRLHPTFSCAQHVDRTVLAMICAIRVHSQRMEQNDMRW